MIFGREPARWIGLIVALILGAVATLSGQGFISDVLKGQVTDIVNATAQLLTLLSPIIAAEFIRKNVTPASAPVLEAGTKVTTPAGHPAVVEYKAPATKAASA